MIFASSSELISLCVASLPPASSSPWISSGFGAGTASHMLQVSTLRRNDESWPRFRWQAESLVKNLTKKQNHSKSFRIEFKKISFQVAVFTDFHSTFYDITAFRHLISPTCVWTLNSKPFRDLATDFWKDFNARCESLEPLTKNRGFLFLELEAPPEASAPQLSEDNLVDVDDGSGDSKFRT